ncbi:NAD+ synthase [bacterium]|nr:NAD+ synthase [bacterium]
MKDARDWDWLIPAPAATALASGFIAETVAAAGAAGVVIGLSGGIDSAVAAALAKEGLGADRVRGAALPYRASHPDSLADAEAVAACLDIALERRDITAMADAFMAEIPADARVRRGNVMARCRMIVMYDISARDGTLVLGTGNRTETLLGYATLFGDAAFSLNPLGDLYKAEVRSLARHFGLPRTILEKAPSADLWAGQTDEDELGFTYEEADRLLHAMVDDGLGDRQLAALGFRPDLVTAVRARVRAQAFKWLPVPTARFPGRPMPDLSGKGGSRS